MQTKKTFVGLEYCPICHGEGILDMSFDKHKGLQSKMCKCVNEKIVLSDCPLLRATKYADKMDYQLGMSMSNNLNNRHFFGDLNKFLYITKLTFMFCVNKHDYHITESQSIIERFSVLSTDNPSDCLEFLYNRKFLVILLNSLTPYPSLKSTIGALIRGRYLSNKPTWIYTRNESVSSLLEYSETLEEFVNKFQCSNINKFLPDPPDNFHSMNDRLGNM